MRRSNPQAVIWPDKWEIASPENLAMTWLNSSTMLYFCIVVIARAFFARSNPLVIGRLLTLDLQGDCFGGYRRLAMTGDR